MKKLLKFIGITFFIGLFSGCDLIDALDDPTPTQTLMRDGMWKVTAVYDNSAPTTNIVDSIQLGLGSVNVPFIFNMKDMNDLNCTAGPLFLYLVYGDGKWTNIAGKVDQVFDYLEGDAITSGTWGIADGVVEKFMLKVKLQPPGFNSLVSVLGDVFGLDAFSQKLDKYVVHKFKFVDVYFEGEKMIWEVTDSVETEYFTELFNATSGDLEEVPFYIEGTKFSRCKIVMEKWSGAAESQELYDKLK